MSHANTQCGHLKPTRLFVLVSQGLSLFLSGHWGMPVIILDLWTLIKLSEYVQTLQNL